MVVKFPKARGKFNNNQMLSELTWLRVGGPAEYFFQPADLEDLMSFMSNLPDNLSFFPLGVGSNLLVRDGGIKGAVVRLGRGFNSVEVSNGLVVAGAGALDALVARTAADHGYDLTFLRTIPGSIGGAIIMNSGCYDHDISQILISIRAIDKKNCKEIELKKENKNFVYRGNNLSKDLKNVSRSFAVDNIKAVNTVKVGDNIVSLSNTDVDGINQTFEFLNFDINDKNVLILGSGGSAQTAQYTLSENNKVYLVSRNKKDGDLTYSDLNEIAGDIEVIINTTPLGMPPYENEKLPISLLNFSKLELFYNFGYGVSKKLTSELPNNVTSIDGTIMLIAQAISSFNIWTGQSIKFNEAYKEILERIDHEN